MKNIKTAVLMGVFLLAIGAQAGAKTIRASEMGSGLWSEFSQGKLSDVIIEFRQGDELPVSLVAEGDLIETKQSSVTYVGVKRNFWLSLNKNTIQISLDGVAFKNISDALSGKLEVGAGAGQNGGVANSINIMLKAFLK